MDTECVRFKGVLEAEIGKAKETFKDADAKYLRKVSFGEKQMGEAETSRHASRQAFSCF